MPSKQLTMVLLLGVLIVNARAQEPPWDPARVKPCDRSCLTGIMDRYLDAMMKHDRTGLPLEPELRMTENAAQIAVGEGILWRARVEPTTLQALCRRPDRRAGGAADRAQHRGQAGSRRDPVESGTSPHSGNRAAPRPQRRSAGHGASSDATT